MTSPIGYQAVLADLEAKRGQLDAAIAVIRAMISGGMPDAGNDGSESDAAPAAPTAPRPTRHHTPAATAIQSDTFFGLSTPSAIRKYLGMMKRPQKIPDISRALREGGQVHARDVTTAYNNVYAALKRMRKAGEAVRIKSGEWALAEWYTSNKPKPESE